MAARAATGCGRSCRHSNAVTRSYGPRSAALVMSRWYMCTRSARPAAAASPGLRDGGKLPGRGGELASQRGQIGELVRVGEHLGHAGPQPVAARVGLLAGVEYLDQAAGGLLFKPLPRVPRRGAARGGKRR